MESKKINQLATELAPDLSDLTIIGDPTTGISKKITLSQMASLFTGTVEEYATLAAFPLVGVADTIYIALDTNIIYRYDTSLSTYVVLSPNIINSLVFSDANGFDGTITLVGSVATLSITTALTLGSVPFIGASGALIQDNANLFFDDTNNRLGIATASPTTPLDVFGSGIIGRLNATSTNNAYLGFASNGTNKWSAGNVQSDHRFRIFSEANSAELITILQTGEFGIGIANPLTKLHIDGGATALIANLDANVSVAKSISFRSDNSSRINLEVSGTESGTNAGADFFLRTFTDAGSLLETPFTIVRSTGVTTIKSLTLTNVLSVANGGTGSATQNFVDLTTTQSIGGAKTFTSALAGTSATFSGNVTVNAEELLINKAGGAFVTLQTSNTTDTQYIQFKDSGGATGAIFYNHTNDSLTLKSGGNNSLVLASTGAATFSSDLAIGGQSNIYSGLAGLYAIQNGNSSYYSYAQEGGLVGNAYYGSGWKYKTSNEASRYNQNAGVHVWDTASSGTANAALTWNERMRITSGGGVRINTTATGTSNPFLYVYNSDGGRLVATFEVGIVSDGFTAISFANNNGQKGSIAINSNSTTYNTTSDYRLKHDLKDFNALDKVSKIKIYDFAWESNGERNDGVMAHELQEVIPYAVNGKKDAVNEDGSIKPQGVDYSMIVPTLIKAIQEMNTKFDEQNQTIQNLQEQIDILKAK